MEKFLEFYSKYKDYILFAISLIIFMMIQALVFWYFTNDINNLKESIKEASVLVEKENKEEETTLIVDIKGEVKTPGVYYLEEGKRVIDVVKKAGGFTKNADTSVNNLSKKITDEMVIIIYSKDEVKDFLSTKKQEEELLDICTSKIENNSCISKSGNESISNTTSNSNDNNSDDNSNSEESKKLISINTATLEELMTLSGIGESKAKAIIEYRDKKKFETIDEIKEVSGIGDSLFEKIKDNITI